MNNHVYLSIDYLLYHEYSRNNCSENSIPRAHDLFHTARQYCIIVIKLVIVTKPYSNVPIPGSWNASITLTPVWG